MRGYIQCCGSHQLPCPKQIKSVRKTIDAKKKGPPCGEPFSLYKRLAMTYSHMGKPHTTIGDESFHF